MQSEEDKFIANLTSRTTLKDLHSVVKISQVQSNTDSSLKINLKDEVIEVIFANTIEETKNTTNSVKRIIDKSTDDKKLNQVNSDKRSQTYCS